MPNYTNVTCRSLKDLLTYIHDYLCSNDDNFAVLCMCLVWLYEYCVCKAFMLLNNVDTIQSKVATATTLKSLLSNSKCDYSGLINEFMRVRNGIAHGDITVLRSHKIPMLLHTINFYNLLRSLDVDVETMRALYSFNAFIYFDAQSYLASKIGNKYNLLPIASVNDCRSVADCEELLSEVDYLLH